MLNIDFRSNADHPEHTIRNGVAVIKSFREGNIAETQDAIFDAPLAQNCEPLFVGEYLFHPDLNKSYICFKSGKIVSIMY